MQKITILYERLSRDDELQGTSNSILNQKQFLEDYAERNGLTPYIHIEDDGFSGTNFKRPGWQELIAKVENDEVGCIIIKDSSRMARNYLQAGLYREMFHEKGIRLIAVNDGIDTINGEDDFTPFREIMAEWYAKDVSKKIKAAVQTKAKSGKPITHTPIYGYIKDTNDKDKWLIDPEAAEVVRRIFQMTVEGLGIGTICKILNDEKIERPSYYLGSRGRGIFKNRYDRELPYAWGSGTIIKILKSAEYAGHTVNCRTTSTNFKSKKQDKNAPEDWIIFLNTHEPIIEQATFDLVQKLRETPRKAVSCGEPNPLTGILWCSDCGAKLYNHRKSKTEKPTHTKLTDVYHCSTYKLSNQKFNTHCTSHYISTEQARDIILTAIKNTSGYVRDYESEFIERVCEFSADKRDETAKNHKKQIARNEQRISELEQIFRSLYEDKALGKINEDLFNEMTGGYTQERLELRTKSDKLQKELDECNADSVKADKFIEIVQRYTNFDELTTPMLNEFIDKVVVYEGEWSEGINPENKRPMGTRKQRVDVYLKYIGDFSVPDMRTAEQIEADRLAEEKLEAKRKYQREKVRAYTEKKREKAGKSA